MERLRGVLALMHWTKWLIVTGAAAVVASWELGSADGVLVGIFTVGLGWVMCARRSKEALKTTTRIPAGQPYTPAPDELDVSSGKDAHVEIVGESNYQDVLKIVGEEGETVHVIALVRSEPRNRYDKNAVEVLIAGRTVGHLSRENALKYQPMVMAIEAKGKRIVCRAKIRGGWEMANGDLASYGVWLDLPSKF